MNKKWLVVGVIFIVLLLIGFNVWNSSEATNTIAVETGTLEKKEMKESVMTPGVLALNDTQYVYYQADKGDIKDIHVSAGEKVKKGDKLLRYENKQLELDQEQNQLQINSAYIDLDQLKKDREEADRNVEENPDNDMMIQERDDIKRQQRQANNELDQALLQKRSLEDEVDALTVQADVGGTVLSVDEEARAKGQMGEAAIIQIGSLDNMHVTGVISEYDTMSIEEEQSVKLTSDAVPDESWQGEISYISDLPEDEVQGIGEENTGVDYPIEVSIHDEINLKPGFQMLLEIVISEDKVPTLPISSVMQEDEDNYVYIVKDGKAKRKEVQVGAVDTERMEIEKGVTDKEKVIIEPSEDISDGVEVTIQ